MLKYIKLKENVSGCNYIKIELYYDKGEAGYNGHDVKRGYYVSAAPMKVENKGSYNVESYSAYSGYKCLITEVKRKSKKAEAEAEAEAAPIIENMIQRIIYNNGLELMEV